MAASSIVQLLADAFSVSLKGKVYTYEAYCAEKAKRGGELFTEELNILKLFELSYISAPFGDVDPASSLGASLQGMSVSASSSSTTSGSLATASVPEFLVIVKNIIGKSSTLSFHTTLASTTVLDLKKALSVTEGGAGGVPVAQQRLVFASQPLEDDTRSLESYELHNEAVVYLVVRTDTKGAASEVFHIDPKLLHPSYDYDFTNINDAGQTFRRGGYPYYRPCGWKRLALRVLGIFGEDKWLGSTGSAPGEWPVCYHGTANGPNERNIAQDGYELSKGRGFQPGKGVYCTPYVKVAEKYAVEFEHSGRRYKILLQSRVSPQDLKIIPERTPGDGEYWVQPDPEKIRAYSICYKQI